MIYFLIFLFLPILTYKLQLHTYLAQLGQIGQNLCLDFLPTSHVLKSWSQSLICGIDLPKNEIHRSMTSSGLIHLVVAYASHLQFLISAISITLFFNKSEKINRVVILFCLLLYSWLCGFQPPIIRGLVAFILSLFSSSVLANQLISVLLILSFLPQWVHSNSLLLSALAGIAICTLVPNSNSIKKTILQSILIYLLLFPCLYGWSNSHPTTIIFNLCLNTALGIIAIPLTLLSCFFSFSRTVIDPFLMYFFKLINQLSISLSASDSYTQKNILYFWFFFASIYCLQHMHQIVTQRNRC